jgi:hypothetical protein
MRLQKHRGSGIVCLALFTFFIVLSRLPAYADAPNKWLLLGNWFGGERVLEMIQDQPHRVVERARTEVFGASTNPQERWRGNHWDNPVNLKTALLKSRFDLLRKRPCLVVSNSTGNLKSIFLNTLTRHHGNHFSDFLWEQSRTLLHFNIVSNLLGFRSLCLHFHDSGFRSKRSCPLMLCLGNTYERPRLSAWLGPWSLMCRKVCLQRKLAAL